LQNSWNRTKDKPTFEFSIIEEVTDISKLFEREQYWIDYYQSYKHDFGYNIDYKAGEVPRVIQREIEQKKKRKNKFDNKLKLIETLKNNLLNKANDYKDILIEIEVLEHINPSVNYINQQILLFTYSSDLLDCIYNQYIKYHSKNKYTLILRVSGCSNLNNARYYIHENDNCIVVMDANEVVKIKEKFNLDNISAIKFLVFEENHYGLSRLKGKCESQH
jgi:hypothetical protein